jgi:hypothetical protein
MLFTNYNDNYSILFVFSMSSIRNLLFITTREVQESKELHCLLPITNTTNVWLVGFTHSSNFVCFYPYCIAMLLFYFWCSASRNLDEEGFRFRVRRNVEEPKKGLGLLCVWLWRENEKRDWLFRTFFSSLFLAYQTQH